MSAIEDTWHYREQDGHPEIQLGLPYTRPTYMLRRVEFARLRAEGFSFTGAAGIIGLNDHQRVNYERRRLASAQMYREMSSRCARMDDPETGE